MLIRVLGRQSLRNIACLSLVMAFALKAQASPAGALYLLEQPSARAMSWGNVAAASDMGVESLRSNPAGMTGAKKFELGLAHHFGADGWTYDWMGLTLPLGQWSLGAEFFTGQLEPIPDYDAFGNQTGEIRISNGTGGLGLAWRSAQGGLSLGLAGRYFASEVAQYSNDGWAVDFGAQASLPWRIRLGLALVNLGEQSAYISRAAPLPSGGRAALQWLLIDGRVVGLTARAEYDHFEEVVAMPLFIGGLEFSLLRRFYLSAGMQGGEYVNQAVFGAAYEGDWLSISYAYLPGELDDGSMLLTLKSKGWPFSRSGAADLEKGLLTIKLAGEESLPPLESWRLEYLDILGKTLKTRDGDGDLPAQVAWDGMTDQGVKVDVKSAKRLRITVTDRQGVVSSNERNIGLDAKPRELQRSAPLFVGSADSLGGMRLRTQFDRELTLKSWTLKVKDADGLLLKTIEGKGALPRSVDLGSLGLEKKGQWDAPLKYDFTAETDDGRLSSLGSLAKSIQPKELLTERPSYDPANKQLTLDIRPKMAASIKEWTLTVKSADGLVLKTISGRGPVPKDLAFDPDSIKLPGLDLGQRKSGSAFVQVALAYTGSDGVSSVVSDVLPLPSKAQGSAAPVDALQADAFNPVPGREFVVLALPALRSLKPKQVARAAQLFRLPEGAESRAWAVEFLSGSRVLGRMKDSGIVPAFITWSGPAAGEPALDDASLDNLRMRVTLDEKVGTPSVLDQGEPMRRSFSTASGSHSLRRVHAAWFSQGETDLQPEMLARLDLLAEQLKAKPKAMAVIQGHCSKEGDAASNARLAEQRAQSVLRYLSAEKGVPTSQLSARGFSNELLLDERADEDAVRRNRRVDVVVVE